MDVTLPLVPKLYFKCNYPDAKRPIITHAANMSDCVFNFFAYSQSETGRAIQLVIPPKTVKLVSTGIKISTTPGYRLQLITKNSFISNNLFIIDTIYDRLDELIIPIYNGGHASVFIRHEDPVAQGILAAEYVNFNALVEEK